MSRGSACTRRGKMLGSRATRIVNQKRLEAETITRESQKTRWAPSGVCEDRMVLMKALIAEDEKGSALGKKDS